MILQGITLLLYPWLITLQVLKLRTFDGKRRLWRKFANQWAQMISRAKSLIKFLKKISTGCEAWKTCGRQGHHLKHSILIKYQKTPKNSTHPYIDEIMLCGPRRRTSSYSVTGMSRIAWDWYILANSFSLHRLSARLQQTQLEAGPDSPPILTFDKDDEDTLDFVAATANLRSLIFGIEGRSKFDIKRGSSSLIVL